MAKLTPEACRAARALLKWSVRDLMAAAGVSPNTITALEGGSPIRSATEAKIVSAFADRGVEITNGDGTGVRASAAALLIRDRLAQAEALAEGSPYAIEIRDLGKVVIVQAQRGGPDDVRGQQIERKSIALGEGNPLIDIMDAVLRECGWQP